MTARVLQPGRRPAAGFTLPEVLVSLFIFGLIAALILAVLDMERRAEAGARRRDDGTAEIGAAQDLLRGRIEALRPVIDVRRAGDTLTIRGTPTRFAFDSPPLEGQGPHALRHYRIVLSPQGNLDLWSASTVSLVETTTETLAGWTRLPLVGKVRAIRFGYYGYDPVRHADAWQDRWAERREPPKLVRLRLAFGDDDARIWPVLMVRPLSNVHQPCAKPDPATASDNPPTPADDCGDAM